MNILIECFASKESGPVFAFNIARALKTNGVNVFVSISDNMDNIIDWKKEFPEQNRFEWRSNAKSHYLNIIYNVYKYRRKFKNVFFDYVLIPFPVKRDLLLSKAINYSQNIMILHDVIAHSSTDNSMTEYISNVVAKADNIMVLSQKYISLVCEKFGKSREQIFYVRHGLMEYPSYIGEFTEIEQSNRINFLYFGRIDGYKGLHVLSKAFSNLSSEFSDISLTVAGGGDFSEYEQEYRNLPRTKVMNKYITDEEIAYLFSVPNTVVVLPYIDATQSGVIGMAYNYLCPIIATDTGGIKEQLFDGKVGLLAEPGNADDLEIKMRCFITDKSVYQKQYELMKESKNKMTWEYITREFINELEKR